MKGLTYNQGRYVIHGGLYRELPVLGTDES